MDTTKKFKELVKEYDISPNHADRVTEKALAAVENNKRYQALSNLELEIPAKANTFSALYAAVNSYHEGNIIHGASLFVALLRGGVYSEKLTYDENLKSYDSLIDDIICMDSKNVDKFKAGMEDLKAKTIPFLKIFCEKNAIKDQIKIDILNEAIKSGSAKKRKNNVG